MAYSSQFIKVTWQWKILGTDEIANTSLNFTSSPGWTGAAGNLTAMGGGNTLSTLMTDMKNLINYIGQADYSALSSVKAAAIGTDGHYLVDPIEYEATAPVAGTESNIPPQITLCASLRSASSLGSGNYGRMYIPFTLPVMGNDSPYIEPSNVAGICEVLKTFVNNANITVNAAGPSVVFPAIMSNKGSGTGKRITRVGTGKVLDTQRRRRNRLDDTATLVSL